MKEADEEERMLRRYLLGELDEDKQERVEERFITDREFKERVLMTEGELVEDYLASELSETEKEMFLRHFLSTPEQHRKLRIAGSLKKHLTVGIPRLPTEPGGEVRPSGVRESVFKGWPFRRNPMVLALVSLGLFFAVVFGLVWMAGVQQRRNQLAEVRRELEQLNNQSASNGSRWVFLTPLATRGGGEANTLTPSIDGTAAQLWLMLVKDEYQRYQVGFQKEGDVEQFPISGLRAATTPRGKAVPVRIPARLLSPGVYILKLNGVADDGRVEVIGEYRFSLTP